MNKKKLLILSDADFVGGAEVNYKIIVPEFHKSNWEVHWMTSDRTGSVEKILNPSVFTFHPVLNSYLTLSNPGTKNFSPRNTARIFYQLFRNIRLINKFIKENEIDVVLSISMMSHFSQIFIKAPRKIAHIEDHINRRKAFGFYGVGLDAIVRNVDHVILCSEFLRENYAAGLQKKSKIIYNPLEQVQTNQKRIKNKIGMFARYVSWKGHEDFIAIAKEAIRLDSSLEFVAFGNISDANRTYYDSLNKEIDLLELGSHISLNGFTPHIQKEMASCSVILHLSKSPEPFGRIIVEAAQLGVPVFGYHGGGGTEIFQKFNIPGKLVNPGDIREIVKLVLDRESFQNTKTDLSSLTKENIANEFIELFESK